jgi:hypothetical protein
MFSWFKKKRPRPKASHNVGVATHRLLFEDGRILEQKVYGYVYSSYFDPDTLILSLAKNMTPITGNVVELALDSKADDKTRYAGFVTMSEVIKVEDYYVED